MVIDNNRVAHRCSCQVGIFGSDAGGERRISADFFDCLSEQAAQPVAVCGHDQHSVTEIGDLDWSAVGNVPSATGLSGQRHLAPARDVMANDRHTYTLQDKATRLQVERVGVAQDGPYNPSKGGHPPAVHPDG